LPTCRADNAVLVGVLEGLDDSDGFIDIAAHLLVVDGDRSDLSLSVDDEQSSESSSIEAVLWILNQNSILP
jgi:hypothetical protein